MRRPLLLKIHQLTLGCFALLVPIKATAQSDPWVGRWGAPSCGPDETAIVLSRSELDLSTFEMVCSVRSVRRRGEAFDVKAICQGEGGKGPASFSIHVSGNVLTFVGLRGIEFDPKRFQRCAAAQSRREDSLAGVAAFPAATAPELPLRRGYYVSDGTSCRLASNATLNLLRRNAMGAARELCKFEAIEKIGSVRYRVVENCADGAKQTVVYEIRNPRSYRRIDSNGFLYSARYCSQNELPAPWKTNLIDDLIR